MCVDRCTDIKLYWITLYLTLRRFYCSFPDEFLFTEMATLNGITLAVKNGEMTLEQKRLLEGHGPESGGGGGVSEMTSGVVPVVGGGRIQRQPLCPWFTCCY